MAPEAKQSSKLRVAQIIETLAVGGAEHLAVKTANHLAAAGHESHLIVTSAPDVLSARISPDVKVHYLHFERSSIRNPLSFGMSLRRGVKLIDEVIIREKITVAQTHLPGSNFFGLLLAWKKSCGVLATIHNNQEFNYGDTDNQVLASLRKKAYRKILDSCQGMIAVSDEVRESLIRELKLGRDAAERISVVTNAVEIPEAQDPEIRRTLRVESGAKEGETLILAAGRFCEQKNFADLVTAAAQLKESGTPFRLVVGGDGEQQAELADQVRELGLQDEVSLPGNLTNLDQVMQASDIFVMSSLWEGLPLVLLEAMAAGLPVVAFGIPGVDELVSDGVTGVTAPVGDTAALAAGMEKLSRDGALRQRLGESGQQRIRSEFGFDEYVAKLCVLYGRAAAPWEGAGS